MASEIKINGYTTGGTLYAVIENSAGQIYRSDTHVFESYTGGNWASYATLLAEQGVSGRYRATFPSFIASAGVYNIAVYNRSGGSAVVGDACLGGSDIEWKGAAELSSAADMNTQLAKLNFTGSAVQALSTLDLTQAIPNSNTAQTVGDALLAARAQGFGKWALSGTTLTLYASDGTTAVRTFTLDSATTPTQRS